MPAHSDSSQRPDFAILTVVPEAYDAARDLLGLNCREDPPQDDHIYYSGYVDARDGGRHFVVCGCPVERGNISATAFTKDFLNTWNPSRLLVADVGGGVFGRDNLHLGDVVANEALHYYEFEKRSPSGPAPRYLTMQPSSQRLRALARDAQTSSAWHELITARRPSDPLGDTTRAYDGAVDCNARKLPELTLGEIIVGEKLLGDPDDELLKELLAKHDKAKVVEMESAGVAHAVWGARSSIPAQFLVLRGISDFANLGGNQETRDLWKPYAAQAAVAAAKSIIELERPAPQNSGPGSTGPPSYRRDIEKLIAHSRNNIDRFGAFSTIRGDDSKPIKVARQAPRALLLALDEGSLLVTGEPGAGKSAALYETAMLRSQAGDVLLLASDTLTAGSLGQLRDELGLENEVVDVLQNWPGSDHKYLLIDALDAARGEHTQKTLLDLIESALRDTSNWRMAVSIRRYDLRYNATLQNLFGAMSRNIAPEFRLPEFEAIRHFNVPLLTDLELAQLETLAPSLADALTNSTPELQDLIRTPFNLRLFADLVRTNVTKSELEPIRTQLQLMDKYWKYRVLDSPDRDRLEGVVRAVCDEMLANRSLRIDRATLQADAAPVHELLSRRVLTELENVGDIEREILTFSHHILFDYAVSRLVFRGVESKAIIRTLSMPALVLTVRPSYELYFQHLWESAPNRQSFWSQAIRFGAESQLPEIGKIIAPGLAAKRIKCSGDFEFLLDSLTGPPDQRRGSELVLRHLVGARVLSSPGDDAIPDDGRGIWCEFAQSLSGTIRPETAYPLATLLQELCAKPERMAEEQMRDVGVAARSLAIWLRQMASQDRRMLRLAIEGIIRTFRSDPAASEVLLRLPLEPDRMKAVGFVEIPVLAHEISSLIDLSPALARDIYVAAFDFDEVSEEETVMRGGVVSLTSTKKQDYRAAYFALKEGFSKLMREAPDEAIDALSAIQRARYNELR